jgi:hypothetical protein
MNQDIFKFIKIIFFIALGIYILDQGSDWLQGEAIDSFPIEVKKFSIYLMHSLLIGGSNIYIAGKLDHLFPWHEVPKKRVLYGIIGAIIVSMISIFLARLILVLGFYGKDWNSFLANENKIQYFYSFLISMVVVMAFYTYYFFKEISKKAIKEHEVVAKTETAKFESLKSQIDPHFLFNSLNVLTSLIEENPKQAEIFTTNLSQIYRYVLEQKDKYLVDLEEELRFAKTYMELLKMRFEEAVQYELPENFSHKNFKIVPLSLQLILENAVKHNVISTEKPLIIKIIEENGNLIITNNFNAKNTLPKGSGVGLKNIIERYSLLTYKKVGIEKTETYFKITLPLLTQITKINNMNTTRINEESRYLNARKKVDKMKEFYSSLTAYLIVIPLLAFINYKTYWGFKWFYFPMIGWGIGLLFHFLDAFGYNWFLGRNWEEKKIQELMNENDKEKWV